jgi:hypothetical protein
MQLEYWKSALAALLMSLDPHSQYKTFWPIIDVTVLQPPFFSVAFTIPGLVLRLGLSPAAMASLQKLVGSIR